MGLATETLTQFILKQQEPEARRGNELATLLTSVSLGVKLISKLVSSAGLPTQCDYCEVNSGECPTRAPLDEQADSILVDLLGSTGHLGLLVSESRDSVVATAVSHTDSQYVVAIDPLDGVSNMGSNIPVGTCFSILRKKSEGRQAVLADFLQSGRSIVAAGYAIYGSKTSFVVSVGDGVKSFTLDSSIGEFVLTQADVKVPQSGRWFSVNEGYARLWAPEVRAFVDVLKSREHNGLPAYMGRYVGSLVADFDRTLREGGVFMHPGSSLWPRGRLHLLYECMPLAFLLEQAGGIATDGEQSLLDIVPRNIHDRCPVFMGSRREMDILHTAFRAQQPENTMPVSKASGMA